ncbi:GNAT family N-acetyltransferase [Nakamurella flava]|uniref:GNAT family N-acetyltransferase n=1 Tax=Nakamurella flava TaxID=2576308 RepID=A0A4U6QM59_9ACTN|nr:GNAT family N-acetyltransferase [Nakamurella flava]TKV61481.1 GNAT family N-acetyltransferase [Nakamurella flava]
MSGTPAPTTDRAVISAIQPDDVEAVVEMVYELAEYEKARSSCHLTAEQLRDALFGPAPALFGTVARTGPGAPVAGFALWFLNYSTWEGVHGIHLEDLYVRPGTRGSGLGKALLTELARIAVERGYARVEWAVLDWNTPAIDFYRSLGAEPMDGWTTFRLSGSALRAAASGRTAAGTG